MLTVLIHTVKKSFLFSIWLILQYMYVIYFYFHVLHRRCGRNKLRGIWCPRRHIWHQRFHRVKPIMIRFIKPYCTEVPYFLHFGTWKKSRYAKFCNLLNHVIGVHVSWKVRKRHALNSELFFLKIYLKGYWRIVKFRSCRLCHGNVY